jgi:hypothetical protein
MTKEEIVRRYNERYPSHKITGVKFMSAEELVMRSTHSAKSLAEVYAKPSDTKVASYREILETYKPREIFSVLGGSHMYSVLLMAENGEVLHITKDNNWLVVVGEENGDEN